MNKRTIIILSAALILLLGAVGGIFWFSFQKSGGRGSGDIGGSFPSSGRRGINGLPGAGKFLPGEPGAASDFVQIVPNAIAGAAIAPSGASGALVRYIEKSTGHIYETNPRGENKRRLTNTTILKIFQSFWSPKADKIVARYLDDKKVIPSAKTFSASIEKAAGSAAGESATSTSGSSGMLSGVFLPKDTAAVAVSPVADKIFYLRNSGVSALGIVADFGDKKRNVVLSLPFGEFNVSWPNKNEIALLTKPSGSEKGFLYFLGPKTGKMKKIMGEIKGLTASVSPNGEKIIYSISAGRGISVKVFGVKSGDSSDFNLKTLPEKCVWSKLSEDVVYCGVPNPLPSAEYPDDWYKGIISFNDSIWSANLSTGETKMILEKTNTDVVNPILTRDENYLIFTNKKDNTLWSLRLGD